MSKREMGHERERRGENLRSKTGTGVHEKNFLHQLQWHSLLCTPLCRMHGYVCAFVNALLRVAGCMKCLFIPEKKVFNVFIL